MVVRRRYRTFFLQLGLYAVMAGLIGYFLHNAEIGHRGLRAKQALKIQIYETTQELEAAKSSHADWDHRIALLRSEHIDRDLLEERARILLGRVNKNDVVIVTP